MNDDRAARASRTAGSLPTGVLSSRHGHERRAWLSILWLSCALLACDDDEQREPLPDWRAGYPDAGSDPDASGDPGTGQVPADAFALVIPSSVNWPVRLGRRDAMDQPCAVPRAAPNTVVECMADVNELDLWVLGLRYDIIVPPDMCSMLLHVPYIFDNFEVGTGPTRVSYTVNNDGTIGDEVNAMNGKPYCPYDHSRTSSTLPNCCMGDYLLEVKSALTGSVTRSTQSWGGKLGDCFFGAGYVQKGARFDSTGLPMAYFTYVHRAAHREPVEYAGVSDTYPSNVALANHFDARDHDGKVPAGLATPRARPYYEAYCLDDAEEIVAHLRLTVREWNQVAEFNALGNPDTTGTEPNWTAGPTAIDDIADWKVLTPGSVAYPSIPIRR